MRRRSRPRGFTIVEVLVAVSLASVFAAIISSVLVQTTDQVNSTVARAVAEDRARQALASLSSALKGARPLAECASPEGPFPLDACDRVAESGPAFTAATETSMEFYSYAGGASGQVLRAPDRVVVAARPVSGTDSRTLLTLAVYRPVAGSTYTTATEWESQPVREETIGIVDSSATVFTYYDSTGNPLDRLTGGTPAEVQQQLEEIALVVAAPRLSWSDGTTAGVVLPRLVVPLPAKVYSSQGGL